MCDLVELPVQENGELSKPIVQIACGRSHVMALNSDGHIFVWGSNDNGQLGLGKLGTHGVGMNKKSSVACTVVDKPI